VARYKLQACCSNVMEVCSRGRPPLAVRWRAGSQVDGGWRPGSPLDGGRRTGSQVAGRRAEIRVAPGRRAQTRVTGGRTVGGDQGHPWTAGTGQGHPWPAGRFGPGLPVDGGRMTGSPPDGGRKSGLHIDPPPPLPYLWTTTATGLDHLQLPYRTDHVLGIRGPHPQNGGVPRGAVLWGGSAMGSAGGNSESHTKSVA
jgi:hypothetical protein